MTQIPKNRLISAFQKIADANESNLSRLKQGEERKKEDNLMEQFILALQSIGKVTSLAGPQGKEGKTPVRGEDYFTVQDIQLFLSEATPKKNKDYFDGDPGKDGKDGYSPVKNVDYFDGIDGKDGIANMGVVTAEIKDATKKHTKEFEHTLIHDPKTLGELELDISKLEDGQLFQRQGKKIVGVDLPKIVQQQVHLGGNTTLRSISVTTSRELDEQGIYVIDASAGNLTITVPSAAGRENYFYELIRIDATANTVTIVPTGSETMSGMTDYVMQQWTNLKLFAYQNNYLLRGAS